MNGNLWANIAVIVVTVGVSGTGWLVWWCEAQEHTRTRHKLWDTQDQIIAHVTRTDIDRSSPTFHFSVAFQDSMAQSLGVSREEIIHALGTAALAHRRTTKEN